MGPNHSFDLLVTLIGSAVGAAFSFGDCSGTVLLSHLALMASMLCSPSRLMMILPCPTSCIAPHLHVARKLGSPDVASGVPSFLPYVAYGLLWLGLSPVRGVHVTWVSCSLAHRILGLNTLFVVANPGLFHHFLGTRTHTHVTVDTFQRCDLATVSTFPLSGSYGILFVTRLVAPMSTATPWPGFLAPCFVKLTLLGVMPSWTTCACKKDAYYSSQWCHLTRRVLDGRPAFDNDPLIYNYFLNSETNAQNGVICATSSVEHRRCRNRHRHRQRLGGTRNNGKVFNCGVSGKIKSGGRSGKYSLSESSLHFTKSCPFAVLCFSCQISPTDISKCRACDGE